MPTLTQLQYVLAVHREKHFGRAAEDCRVSQPSLSAQIQKLEEELGVILFDRSKKPVITTSPGNEVVRLAKEMMLIERKLQDLSLGKGKPAGEFHLGVIPTLSPYVIPLFLESFSKKYPEVALTISEYQTHEIVRMLYDDDLDAGLLVTPLYDARLIERSLFFEPFMVFAGREHPFYEKKIVKDSELDGESVWLLDEGHCFRDQVIRLCALEKKSQVLSNVKFASGNLETLIQLIRRGRGYTLLPLLATRTLSSREKEKNLKPFQKPIPTREVSLVHSRSFLKQEIIDSLEKEIVQSCPSELLALKRSRVDVIDI